MSQCYVPSLKSRFSPMWAPGQTDIRLTATFPGQPGYAGTRKV